MPYLVNGQRVPEAWFREEEQPLGHDLRLNAIADEAERARQLRIAAQNSAIDRMLVEQATAQDPRPIDAQTIEQEVRRQRQAGNRGTAFEDSFLRQWVERQFRLQRTHSEMVAGSAQPAAREVEAFYEANRENFRNPETFHAAHIVRPSWSAASHSPKSTNATPTAKAMEATSGNSPQAKWSRSSKTPSEPSNLASAPASSPRPSASTSPSCAPEQMPVPPPLKKCARTSGASSRCRASTKSISALSRSCAAAPIFVGSPRRPPSFDMPPSPPACSPVPDGMPSLPGSVKAG